MVIPLVGLPIKQSKQVIHLQPVNSNIFICNDPTFKLKKVFIILGRKTQPELMADSEWALSYIQNASVLQLSQVVEVCFLS